MRGARTAVTALAAVILLQMPAAAGADETRFREEFDSLERWQPLTFPKIDRHSTYRVEAADGESILRTESDDSASGIAWREHFNVYEFPRLRWRWKADATYGAGDATRKSGDDYPARIYVVFPYDPARLGFGERLTYKAARLIYGEYPPLAALNYIWANRERGPEPIRNAYTEKAVMIALRGPGDIGVWHVEERNIVEDFRRAFGEDPPPAAGLAIMNDSDDTGEKSVSWIDYIEIRR